nr:hypothetical protein [Tanacetum cinerariifolium]
VRRPKHSGVIWKKKWSSNTSNVDLSAVNFLNLNKNFKRYSHKDLLSCNNSHLGETSGAYVCNAAMNVSCTSSMCDLLDDNNFFIFDDESVKKFPVSKMPFRKNPYDSMNVHSKSNMNKSLPRTVRCSKHMTGNHALLTNFKEKFLGMVRFGNNDFAVIAGYGDVVNGSGTLPGNTVTNPKEDLKGITTRSGVAYKGPTIPTPSKVVKQGTKVTKDQVQTTCSQSTAHVQPPVTQSETLVSEPIAAPFASTLKALIGNKEKLSEMARTPMNEHCSAFILNKLPKKLGDPGKFLIPFEFPGMDECLVLADLAITYNLDQTSRYSANYDQMTANKIDVTDEACEEYFQEVLGFPDVTASGSPTPSNDPIVSTTSPTLTPFGDSDFLLFEEANAFYANAFLGLEEDPDSPKLDPSYYDPEGNIQMLEAILNSDPAPSLPDHEQSEHSFTNELKACEAKTIKSSVDEPPEV